MEAIHEMGKSEGFQVPGYGEVQGGEGPDQSGQGSSNPDEGQGGAKAMRNQLEDVRVKAMRKRMAALEDAIQGTLERIQWAESQPSLGEEAEAKQRHEQLEIMVTELQQSMAEAEALEVKPGASRAQDAAFGLLQLQPIEFVLSGMCWCRCQTGSRSVQCGRVSLAVGAG